MHLSQPKLCTRTALSHGRGGGPDASGSWRAFDRFGSFFSLWYASPFTYVGARSEHRAATIARRNALLPGTGSSVGSCCSPESANDRIIGRLSGVCRPTAGHLSTDYRASLGRLSGHTSTNRSKFGWERRLGWGGYHQPTAGRQSADALQVIGPHSERRGRSILGGGGGENTVVGKYWPVFLSGSTINSEIRSNAKTL